MMHAYSMRFCRQIQKYQVIMPMEIFLKEQYQARQALSSRLEQNIPVSESTTFVLKDYSDNLISFAIVFARVLQYKLKMALRRLQREYDEMCSDETQRNYSAGPKDNDYFHWQGAIVGPSGTPYENGIFFFEIHFPKDYPCLPPRFQFTTRIYHPNIKNGSFLLGILNKDEWKPIKLADILKGIQSMIANPNCHDFYNFQISLEFRNNRAQFEKTAKGWTRTYAS